ncbi:MAG: helix-turn-helix domain-containing protein [Rhizobiaceae bacterium]
MTPFGMHLRELRLGRGVTQKQMATAVGVSAAYLSALEHGKRGTPSYALLQRIAGYLNVIWDDADMLQKIANLSDPRVVIDTSALSPKATETANRLAQSIAGLDEEVLQKIMEQMQPASQKRT